VHAVRGTMSRSTIQGNIFEQDGETRNRPRQSCYHENSLSNIYHNPLCFNATERDLPKRGKMLIFFLARLSSWETPVSKSDSFDPRSYSVDSKFHAHEVDTYVSISARSNTLRLHGSLASTQIHCR
jgi:hypothetical protein